MEEDDIFYLMRPMPHGMRILLGAAGLFCIVTPAWEFRHAFLHPGWFSLFFAVILLGAWSVGGSFVAAAILGEEQRWRVADGRIDIDRRNLCRSWVTTVHGPDVSATTVKEIGWDSGPDTYSVVLGLVSGEEFESPTFEKRENATMLETRLRERLHLD
ncbi:MAG: hypothetical protein CTY15_11720 [Methylocystis sp.]|nr:MAG: hypothetical protein CTY15_11720 [Methylocystis sp.]